MAAPKPSWDCGLGAEIKPLHHVVGRMTIAAADLAIHFPADPEQQDAAGQRQSDDGEELRRDRSEQDAQYDGRTDAPEDDLGAVLGRDTRGRKSDDDGVVARQRHVDQDDVGKCRPIVLVPVRRNEIAELRYGVGQPFHGRVPRD